MTRDGAVDMTQACAAAHYRSSVVGSTLLLQIRPGDSIIMHKTVAAALSTNQIWFMGIGSPTEPGTGNASDPVASIGIYKNNAGFVDFSNRGLVRTGSSADRYESLGITAGAGVATGTNTIMLTPFDGFAVRVNHGSAAAGNMCAFGFRRNMSTAGFLQNNCPQFNLASDRIVLNFISNVSGTLTGAASSVFALHFVRRVVASNPGFLAQS
jgi:hypothetical protein